jgi:hypothetical protein
VLEKKLISKENNLKSLRFSVSNYSKVALQKASDFILELRHQNMHDDMQFSMSIYEEEKNTFEAVKFIHSILIFAKEFSSEFKSSNCYFSLTFNSDGGQRSFSIDENLNSNSILEYLSAFKFDSESKEIFSLETEISSDFINALLADYVNIEEANCDLVLSSKEKDNARGAKIFDNYMSTNYFAKNGSDDVILNAKSRFNSLRDLAKNFRSLTEEIL